MHAYISLSLSIYIYIYTYVCVYIYIHTCMHVHNDSNTCEDTIRSGVIANEIALA